MQNIFQSVDFRRQNFTDMIRTLSNQVLLGFLLIVHYVRGSKKVIFECILQEFLKFDLFRVVIFKHCVDLIFVYRNASVLRQKSNN